MDKVLITGGAGFVGSHLCEALLRQSCEVFVLDDLSTGSLANIAHLQDNSRFRFVKGSILDAAVVQEMVRRVDFVYHLAAAVGVDLVVRSPVQTIERNVWGSENVLAEASKRGVGVLLTSTSEVYGKSNKAAFHEDDDLLIGPPTQGRWSYACSKLLDEFLAIAYWREKKLPVFVVRLFNTVGPRQTGQYGMVLPRFVQQALRQEPLTIYGTGKQSRCFCHVGDVIRALIELPAQSDAIGQVYNVGSTEEIAIVDLAKRVKQLTKSRSDLRFVPYDQAYSKGFEDMLRRKPGIEKIQQLFGWQPTQTLDDIVRSTIEYHRTTNPTTTDGAVTRPGFGE